ncbi:MAG: TldD/PmbA family protein [Candidatus Heimdallarchaeota archaeon]
MLVQSFLEEANMLEKAIELAEKTIKACKKKGMTEIEIFLSYNNQKQVIMNGKSIGTQRARDEIGVGIRVIHDSAEGFSYTNILTLDSLTKTADDAFSVAKLSAKIEGLALPDKAKVPELKGVYNEDLVNLEADELTKAGLDFIDGYTSVDDRINTVLSSIAANVNQTAILNSNDLFVQRKSANYQGGMLCVASDKNKAGGYVFENLFSRKKDLDFKATGIELGKRSLEGLKQETIDAFEGEVIFKEPAMISPITIAVGLAVSADWRQRGMSFWKDKLGDTVADERFNFVDKPHNLEGGAGIAAFDDEGVASKEHEIIKDGVLQTFLHNTRTANKENLESTGNAVRSMGGQPSFAQKPTNIFPHSPWIQTGDMSDEELIAETKKGILVHNYQGTVRYQNGIFSGVAKGAHLIENGEIVKPVTGVSISGNVFEILNNISGIGKEYHQTNFVRTPWMKFEGIRISTK